MATPEEILTAQIGDTVTTTTKYEIAHGTIIDKRRSKITVQWDGRKRPSHYTTSAKYDALMLQPNHQRRRNSGDP